MDNDIIAERRKIGLALNAGLMDGISAIKAKEGYVWVLDIQTDSLVGGEGLKDSGDGYYYFQEPSLDIAPPVVLPAAIYLTIMEAGAKPTDVILEDSNTTLEDAFVHGIDSAMAQSIERYLPNSYYEQSMAIQQMGMLAVEQDDQRLKTGKTEASNYQELQEMQFLPDNMLRWMNAVARGGFYDSSFEKYADKDVFSPESVKRLQEMLRLNVTDGLANGANSDVVPISGITYVSLYDKKWRRRISFCGYFPSDNPQYGVYVELIRKEQLEDPLMKEWPELGKGAAIVCKSIAEMFVKQGQKHLQTINNVHIEENERVKEDDSLVPVIKAVTVKSVDGIGITF